MNQILNRRDFLKRAAAGAGALGVAELGLGRAFPPVSAAEAKLPTAQVRFAPEIEPLVRLLEETPRERVLEEFATRIRSGTSYREVLAALLLAGVRNLQPRPVGFKFHAVLVVNSAHLASLNSPDRDRWLPIFWGLDQFKSSQARAEQEGHWTLAAVEEAALPPAHRAKRAFIDAMENWDAAAADAAVTVLARTAGPQEIFEVFARLGARDFRDIGHKAIYTANSWRTLQNIGWQHAEPVLRSLAYALLEHEDTNPAKRDGTPDRPGRYNLTLTGKVHDDWLTGKVDSEAAHEMAATLRQANATEAADQVVELLNRGISPQSVWDAILSGATELLMRQPGIVSLHSVTTSNALRYAWDHTAHDQTRRWLCLQAAAFLTLFRDRLGNGQPNAVELTPLMPKAPGPEVVTDIFATIDQSRPEAARLALGYLEAGGSVSAFMNTARRLIYLKGNDAHDYKFSEAALEDYEHVTAPMRNRFLAATVFYLRGAGGADNSLVERTRAAFAH